ncbi:MAG: hypothetical protein WCT26_04285 [Candidatus Buchananbacteria bacterium]|jgi:type III secretory pathway component EscT
MFVTGLGAICFLGIWAVAFVFHTGQEIADWVECQISDSLLWHAVIIIGGCFPFMWLALNVLDILTQDANMLRAAYLVSSIAGMTLIAGMIIEFIAIRHHDYVESDELDNSEIGNVVNFARPRN